MKKGIFFILFYFIAFSACEKIESYPDIPEIKLENFKVQLEETALNKTLFGKLTFSFIDGDGDIGFPENSDTLKDNNKPDVIIKEFYKENGVFIEDTIGPYLLPYFPENLYRKSLKGEIEINIPRIIESPDTVYYEFYIIDRLNHKSNIESTPILIYSELAKQ